MNGTACVMSDDPRGVRQVSNGTTKWTVRYSASGGHHVHYKVFHDQAAAESFAQWWERRGEGFESVVLPR